MADDNFYPTRLIAIGDIHGMRDMLDRLLNYVSPQPEDQFVFLGDYVDRGKDSRGVIERLIRFKNDFPHTIFIRGNHDQLLLDVLVELGVRADDRLRDQSKEYSEYSPASDLEIFLVNGGNETLRSYRLRDMTAFPQEHMRFLESTLLWWRFDNFVFVHAGVEEGVPLELQDPYVLLWERMSPPGKDGEIHVVGHHPTQGDPYFEPGRFKLDTGAVYGRTLTACDVLSKQIWQVR
ncbi:MAG: serine/threonine protein phosphatase [Deltaproteobacteria bacterium]|jgi:serine/threonine protein phosphatase 1|nr:serine/threonine protein phosphatase [Deltaproteobacteria bacterium]